MSPLFQVHKLNDAGMAKARAIAEGFNALLEQLEGQCGAGREFALAKTHLEQACIYAKKAMATQPENQVAP